MDCLIIDRPLLFERELVWYPMGVMESSIVLVRTNFMTVNNQFLGKYFDSLRSIVFYSMLIAVLAVGVSFIKIFLAFWDYWRLSAGLSETGTS